MADVKISGLPASTTPLAGTEVLPIVQGAATRKVAVSDLTAGRAVSALSVTATTVNGTTFDTNVAAAGVTLAGTTLAADGTDANINLNLVAKGTGQVLINAGAVATPTIAPTGDTNTGIYFPTADTIGFTEGGVEALRINANAQTTSGIAGTASLPSFSRTGDENTGIFFPAADTIAFAEGGAEAMRLHASSGVSIGNTTDPGATNLSVTGTVNGQTILSGSQSLAGSTTYTCTITATGTPFAYEFNIGGYVFAGIGYFQLNLSAGGAAQGTTFYNVTDVVRASNGITIGATTKATASTVTFTITVPATGATVAWHLSGQKGNGTISVAIV